MPSGLICNEPMVDQASGGSWINLHAIELSSLALWNVAGVVWFEQDPALETPSVAKLQQLLSHLSATEVVVGNEP